MGTNEYSQPASKSSWDSQDFGDVKRVLKMVHFHNSSRPQWVNVDYRCPKLNAGLAIFVKRGGHRNMHITICFVITITSEWAR